MKEKMTEIKRNNPSDNSSNGFTIVGIGASAGGLEALESFFRNVPEASGMAFVVVQHMDPTRKGILVELLQRSTPMKVVQVNEGTTLQPNGIYVIPPNKTMSINHGVIQLTEHLAPRGHQLPIDFFFKSLAQETVERSIGVILSGMGSDGTLGLRAIKEKGGAVFVQQPSSAKFDGMPQSVIDAGLADFVSPVESLPADIITYLDHKPLLERTYPDLTNSDRSAIDKITILLRAQTGHDFSAYKISTISRRIERRMGIHLIGEINNYVNFLQKNPQELDLLFKELLIGVTSFFREPKEWGLLREKVIPQLLENRESNTLRAWVPACSTGEEAYSLAITFMEVLEELKPVHNFSLQIFATDLDRHAIDKARDAVFPANIVADLSPEQKRYFVEVDEGYQVVKSIRDMVIFAPQNIIMDPPFTRLDILSCRNLLIYLTADLQKKLLPLFHYCLNPGGCLFLGSAETIIGFSDLFAQIHNNSRIYQRLQAPLQAESVGFPASFVPTQTTVSHPSKPVHNIQLLADQLILQHYSPPSVLVNQQGDIVYITGRTGKYLEPAAGRANWNIFAMGREGLRYQLSDTLQKAVRQKQALTYKNAVVGTNGGSQVVDIIVQPLEKPDSLQGMVLVVFKDVDTPTEIINTVNDPNSTQREAELERELMQTRQDLQSARAEMQASHQELKSFNEELQSTNEELQSTNEELTTSKEEMQSLNEELQTVNYELQAKVDELSLVNNDMKNLLDSTEIGTLFLDNNLCIRRFTSQMSVITKLIPGDIGRPITDIASQLIYPGIAEDLVEVLRSSKTVEKQVISGDDCWFNVRILPYHTLEDKIDGVVVTFVDINQYKLLEKELLETKQELELRLSDQGQQLIKARDEIKRGKSEAAAGEIIRQE